MRYCPDRLLEPPTQPRWTELLDDRSGKCVHRFEINNPLCIGCSGKDKECDQYEHE